MSEFDRPDISKLTPMVATVDPAKPDESRSTPFGKALASMPLCSTMPEVARWAGDYWHVIKFALLWAEVSEVAAEAEDGK